MKPRRKAQTTSNARRRRVDADHTRKSKNSRRAAERMDDDPTIRLLLNVNLAVGLFALAILIWSSTPWWPGG